MHCKRRFRFSSSPFHGIDKPRQLVALVLIPFVLAPTIALVGMAQMPNPASPIGIRPTDPLADSAYSCINGTKSLSPTVARVAFVRPTFTLTPYANFRHSFYAFYIKYSHAEGPITTDLNWLRTPVMSNWSSPVVNDEKPLYSFLTSQVASRCGLVMGLNLMVIDDVLVHDGGLFVGNTRQYDVLILGHEEYVTRAEYDQFKHFVASGGRIVAMSGNTFWAEVDYSKSTHIETFMAGHGFVFNGVYALRSNFEPFDKESMGWFGSAFALHIPLLQGAILNGTGQIGQAMKKLYHGELAFTHYGYPHNEVNYVGNFTNTQIIAAFYLAPSTKGFAHFTMPYLPVDSYAHKYVKGEVICLCVFGENLISHDQEAQFFLVYSAIHGYGAPPARYLTLTSPPYWSPPTTPEGGWRPPHP
ncbi:MAG TPA: N,N-dimethylformamidase beta subunit family domain-containing protein [Nitrososphaerales archaeon]|nr:N,N-dimethylformamidase beta subunit family domain-containing protein [Nitrososphaerales archaeon]